MAKLTSKERNGMKKTTFGLPGERKYPMPDKAHAANAKARATQMVNKGKLSESSKMKIDAKANKVLGKGKSRVEKMKDMGKARKDLSKKTSFKDTKEARKAYVEAGMY